MNHTSSLVLLTLVVIMVFDAFVDQLQSIVKVLLTSDSSLCVMKFCVILNMLVEQ